MSGCASAGIICGAMLTGMPGAGANWGVGGALVRTEGKAAMAG